MYLLALMVAVAIVGMPHGADAAPSLETAGDQFHLVIAEKVYPAVGNPDRPQPCMRTCTHTYCSTPGLLNLSEPLAPSWLIVARLRVARAPDPPDPMPQELLRPPSA